MIKLRVKIVGNYLIKQIKNLSKCTKTNNYIRCETESNVKKGNKIITKTIYIKFDNDEDQMGNNFITFYHNKKLKKDRDFRYYSLSYYWELYKDRPHSKFLHHIKNINRRYDKNVNIKTKHFYNKVFDYILNKSYRIDDVNIYSTTIYSALHGCKITIKGVNI